MSIILLMRDSCFNQTRTNLGAERLCKNGSSEGSGRKPRYMCRVKQLLMTYFPSCEVDLRQSRRFVHSLPKRNMRVVCMEVKFDPRCKWAVFRAKYLKSEIEFEDHYLLCVCCVFAAFPSFWRPFGAIFRFTVDAIRDITSKYKSQYVTRRRIDR